MKAKTVKVEFPNGGAGYGLGYLAGEKAELPEDFKYKLGDKEITLAKLIEDNIAVLVKE